MAISKDSKFISWDIETYKCCFIIAFEDKEGPADYITCDHVDAVIVKDFLNSLKKYDIHTTYNGKGFDIKVLCWIVDEYEKNPNRRFISVREVGEEAQLYIEENNRNLPKPACKSKVWSAPYSRIAEVRKNHFDLMVYTGGKSLKYWENARCWSVKESETDFKAESMTKDEVLEAARYCRHDVHATWKLTNEKKCVEKLMGREWVLSQIKNSKTTTDMTDAELAETYVYDEDRNLFEYVHNPDEADGVTKILEEDTYSLVPWDDFKSPPAVKKGLMKISTGEWANGFVWNGKETVKIEEQDSEEIKRDGLNPYMKLVKSHRLENENWAAFGSGGAHFCKPKKNKNTKIFDVASLYPHIIKGLIGLKSKRAVERYFNCVLKRIDLKHLKKTNPELYSKAMDLGLKLILNSLSGKFGMKGAKAYAPNHRLAMCIIGQLLITEATAYACGMDESGNVPLENCVEINTDSFAVDQDVEISRAREYCSKKQHNWFTFEEDDFPLSYWKDVNHYVVFEDAEGTKIKEDHGSDSLNSEAVILTSVYFNSIKPEGSKPELPEVDVENLGDWLVKYNKPATAKSASINGEPMKFKNYAFLWVTKDCPDAVDVRFNSTNYDDFGIISPRRGKVIFGGIEEAKQYYQYIDREQYMEDLRDLLVTWHREDMALEFDIFGNVKKKKNPRGLSTWEKLKNGSLVETNDCDLF